MNLEIVAQAEARAREAKVRHHVDERSLERAANRRRNRTAASEAGAGRMSRLIGWLTPKRIATASGTTIMAAPQEYAVTAGDACDGGMDCSASTAEQAA